MEKRDIGRDTPNIQEYAASDGTGPIVAGSAMVAKLTCPRAYSRRYSFHPSHPSERASVVATYISEIVFLNHRLRKRKLTSASSSTEKSVAMHATVSLSAPNPRSVKISGSSERAWRDD